MRLSGQFPTRGSIRALLAATGIALALGVSDDATSAAQSGEAAAQFRARITLVPIEARVIDRNGAPVTDLRQSDFTILEDRVPQAIAHFETQTLSAEAPPEAGSRPRRAADAFELSSSNQRIFLIVLGAGPLEEPAGSITAAIHLVRDRLLPQDLVAIMLLGRVTDFTTARAPIVAMLDRFKQKNVGMDIAMRLHRRSLAAIYGDRRPPKSVRDDIESIFAAGEGVGIRTFNRATAETRHLDDQLRRTGHTALGTGPQDPVDQAEYTRLGGTPDDYLANASTMLSDLQALYGGIESLRDLSGQRHLVYISSGGISPPAVEDDRSLARRAADARVTLNFLHGMTSMFAGQTSRFVTKATGGQFHATRFKNHSVDIDRIDLATRFQYVLGYYPKRDPIDGKYRRIEVRVSRPGVTVLTRDGYLARPSVTPVERKKALIFSRIASAAEYPELMSDLKVSGLVRRPTSARSREYPVELTIDLSRVAFEKQGTLNVASIEVAVFAANRGKDVGHNWQTLNLSYTDVRLAEVRATGLVHRVDIPTTETPRDFKVIVYNYDADLVGSSVMGMPKK